MLTTIFFLTTLYIGQPGTGAHSATSATLPTMASPQQTALLPEGQVTVTRKSVTLKHKKSPDNKYDQDETAIVRFPVLSGLGDETILKKAQKSISLKAVFDQSLEEMKRDFQESYWLDGVDYKVNYNKNFILDVTFWQDGTGAYPSTTYKHRIVNLKTGELLRAADVFESKSLSILLSMCRRAMQIEIRKSKKEHGADVDGQFAHARFSLKNLNDFSVSDKGVTFLYDYDFAHAVKALEPSGRFFFSFESLKPYIKTEGLLGTFVTSKKD